MPLPFGNTSQKKGVSVRDTPFFNSQFLAEAFEFDGEMPHERGFFGYFETP